MNIIQFSASLEAKMKLELDTLNADQDEIIKIGKTLSFIRELITELKVFTRNYKFQNQAEEIQFFKEVKPVFLSQYFYYKKVFAIRLFDSFKDAKSRKANYRSLLKRLERSVEKNLEFYQYCMSGSKFMDTDYFTRGNQSSRSPALDESFSTGYDAKLAKILANELLKKYILTSMNKNNSEIVDGHVLTWTDSKASLIELIYALHSAKVFNQGVADIKHVASTFENLFNISLGNYYRVIQEIRIRKSGQTNFLDQLKSKLENRFNEHGQ
ncbi:MAG: RteC domain-containing protein [Cyclobacteriaceae bacterium]|nr:RteC domain-containing protein [Cyclobacteriaceae bacterium]